MPNYVVAFRGRPDRRPPEGEEEAWGMWFAKMGAAVVDHGHRVNRVQTLPESSSGEPDGRVLTGYIVVSATSIDEATRLVSGCPGLKSGLTLEVGQSAVQSSTG